MNGTFQTWPNRGRYSIRIPVSPILLLFAILGCSGDLSGLVTRDLFGTWSGQAELGAGDSAYLQLRLSHDLDAPTFTGSGTMTIGTFVRPLVVSGNYARQAVTMTMNTSGFDQVILYREPRQHEPERVAERRWVCELGVESSQNV